MLLALRPLLSCTAALLLTVAGPVAAQGRSYALDWPYPHEALRYQSCGCADACWVAEVTDRETQVLRARLRCDCETLLTYRPFAEPERTVAGRCDGINQSADKPGRIREQLQQLLDR